MTKLWTLTTLLTISLFFNVAQFAVLFDNEEYINQQEYAIQYLGDEINSIKNDIDLIDDYRSANEALIQHCKPCDVVKAIKATPLPPMKG